MKALDIDIETRSLPICLKLCKIASKLCESINSKEQVDLKFNSYLNVVGVHYPRST
jgi:hypothetical protein